MTASRFFAANIFAFAFVLFASAINTAAAEEMRIETDVYVGNDAEPQSHTVTLFESGTVYDFVDHPSQIAVFRPPTSSRAGEFALLDVENKQRTDVSTERIGKLMKKLVRWAAEQDDPMLKFSAEPEFEENFDQDTGALSLSSESWQYRAATVPAENANLLASYREYADWYTKLNTMMHGAPPPGPRLKLNAALQSHGVVPVEIHRTVDSESTALRATHLFSWRLSREDQARIDDVRGYLATFKKVGNEAFLAHRHERDVVRGQSK